MGELIFEKDIQDVCAKGSYCFPCVSGLCPLNLDFLSDCYPKLSPEQKQLFNEMVKLRAEIMGNGSGYRRKLLARVVNF